MPANPNSFLVFRPGANGGWDDYTPEVWHNFQPEVGKEVGEGSLVICWVPTGCVQAGHYKRSGVNAVVHLPPAGQDCGDAP